jgi:SSS family solute:Na+ symporter
MIYIILIAYMAFTFWGSLIGVKKHNNTPEGYFLANRNLKAVALFFTILATNFSAFYFLGYAGEGYRKGYSYAIIMSIGTGFAALTILLIAIRTWKLGKKNGYITPSELIYDQTKSKPLRYLYAAVMVIYTIPYITLQIVGGGYILENLTNGDIPYAYATIFLTAFTIAYVLIGGMTSVAKTDFKQGILMVGFMLLAVILISTDLGGLTKANSDLFTPKRWFSFVIFWAFCVPMFPQLFMRFYIAKNTKVLKQSILLYSLAPLLIAAFPVIIGALGHLTFPGLEGKEADQILPMMLGEHTHPYFVAVIMIGAIAAFMSSLDSQLLAVSTITTRDFYIPLTGEKPDFKREVWIGRILVAVFSVIGLALALNPFDTIFDMGKLAFGGYAVLYPVTFAIIRYRRISPAFGIASVLVGQALLIGFYYKLLPSAWTFGFESFIISIAAAVILVVIGVVIKRKK